jgi:hypothetical protein
MQAMDKAIPTPPQIQVSKWLKITMTVLVTTTATLVVTLMVETLHKPSRLL